MTSVAARWSAVGRRIGLVVLVCFCTPVLSAPIPAEPTSEETAQQLRAALREFDGWLAPSPEAKGWHQHLRTDELRAQLDRGDKADPKVVWGVLAQFVSDVPGLDLPEFFRVRRAIENWLASLPPPSMEQLAQEFQLAKAAFIPRTKNDLLAAKAELSEQAKRLDARMAIDKAGARAWKDFLLWQKMQTELAKESPDLRTLDLVFAQFASGHEGLQMNWFADVRDALRRYLLTARTIGDKNLKARYAGVLDDLAGRVKSYRSIPTPEEAKNINANLQFLRDAGQPERLLRAVHAHLSYANVFLRASAWLVGVGLTEPVSETGPVTDNILGTDVYGTAETKGQMTAELAPSPDFGQVDIIFRGTVNSNNVGYNGPVQVYSNSVTQIASRKRLLMDAHHAWSLPAASQAVTSSEISGIQANSRIAQRAASRRVPAQQGQAEQVAAQHAEARANQQIDQRGERDLAKLNAQYAERIRDPLLLYNAFPRLANLSTTTSALQATALEGRLTELASPWAPPEPDQRWDLLAQIHETAINNAANAAYAGAIVEQESFLAGVEKSLGKVPERFRDDDNSAPWKITLADQDPISVAFQDGLLRLTLRGEQYTRGDKSYPAMNITAVYRPKSTAQGILFERQGALEIFPPGFEPGKGQGLSASDQALRSMLERRFNKVFEPQFTPDPLVLGGNWKKAGELRLIEAKSHAGWLVLGWRPIPAGEKPAVKPAAGKPAAGAAKAAPTAAKPAPASAKPAPAKAGPAPAAKTP